MSEQIKLVTSKFSPYGHRVEMVLIEKNIPYQKVEVDLASRPDWFIADSPLGKIPLLYVGDKVLFESIVICEYLEEAFPGNNPLHNKDLVIKSQHRAWMEYSNSIFSSVFAMIFATNQEDFNSKKTEVVNKLRVLEKALKFNPYFDGDKFLLIDICMASVFKPLFFVDNKFLLEIFDLNEALAHYAESLLARGSLQKALPVDYEDIFKSFLGKKKSHLLTMSFML